MYFAQDEGGEGDDDDSMSEDEHMSEGDDIIDDDILDEVDPEHEAADRAIALDVQRMQARAELQQ